MPSRRHYRGNVGRPRKFRYTAQIHFMIDMELLIPLEKIREIKDIPMTMLLHKYIREGIEREKYIVTEPESVTYEKWFTEHKNDKDEDLK